ncbi:tetratricopeptide repeat protein [Halomonas getboli]|uniref:tetratricopeptide repeat protein n=1 Tax=Halomonas getboli TaxID=2935862 RepID=UPI001FFFACF4|nr:tetratricopeptide repeat protein [Halomonas getboli]MCK2184372.1 sel1 repeat family protein [Halomonas getboli]
MRLTHILLASILIILPGIATALEPEVQSAKDEGMRLYNIGESTRALPYLEEVAEAGDVEAMYYMGEAERRQNMGGMTLKAMNWYLQAAEQGDPYAMLRLFQGGACVAGDECPEDAEGWREKALAETLPKAEAGDIDAMLALYHIYRLMDDSGEGVEWLEKAAEAGNPEAQTRLGMNIRGGQGWYFLGSRRLEAAAEWFRKAAEQGYVPAMKSLSEVLIKLEDFEGSWRWSLKGSDLGDESLRTRVGWCYLNPGEYENLAEVDLCPVEQDAVKGWAILAALKEEVGNETASDILEDNKNLLTEEQKRRTEALVEEWVNKGPDVSDFPPRFGF